MSKAPIPDGGTFAEDGTMLHSWESLLIKGGYIFPSQPIDYTKPWNHPDNQDAFKHVQVTVLTPSAKRREMVEVRLDRPAKTGAPEIIGCLRTSKRRCLALLHAADEISRLLDLPLKVTGDSVEGSPEICRCLEELERYKQMFKAAA